MELRNVEQLLVPYLKNGKKYVRCDKKRLLTTGENYGSTMLAIDIFLTDEYGQEEVLNCVAKMTPPYGILWEIFHTVFTFKKEVEVYKTIVPTFNNFGKEHGVESVLTFFAEYYGSRISLDSNSKKIDDDAVMLLRNLRQDGYIVCNRFVGFGKDTTILVLKDLATIHATAIAYKLAYPIEFQKKIMPYLEKSFEFDINQEARKRQIMSFRKAISKFPEIKHLTEKVIDGYNIGLNNLGKQRGPKELFGTFTHGDLWTNNILIKFVNARPTNTKFVDFQVIEYGTAARDVVFLLYSSADMDVLPFIDDMLIIYYNQFVETLTKLNCDPTPFTYEEFLNEISSAATTFEFGHLLFILPPVFTEKGKAMKLTDMRDVIDIIPYAENLHENFFSRFKLIVEDFAKRGWI